MADGMLDVQLTLVDSVEKAQAFLQWLGERRPHDTIGFDIETGELPGNPREDALSPWHGRIRLAQLGDAQKGWAIPWEEWNGVFYEAMKNYDGGIVCHNIAFEAKWMAVQSHWDMPWQKAHDTMLMAHIINPLGSGALKPLAARYVDPRSAELQDSLANQMAVNGWTWGTVPIDYQPYWAYGALDPVITMRLWEQFMEQCGPGQQYSAPYELEMAARKVVTRMEVNGAKIDLDYSKKKYEELLDYTERVKTWALNEQEGLNVASNAQLIRRLEKLGAEITKTTKSGSKSVDEEQLQLLIINGNADVQVLAKTVLSHRKAEKLANSYFLNFINKNVDGYLHPSVKTLGARTGRMSITDPALQTLPSGDPLVRRAFIPKDPEWGIISSDLDQVEFRLAASMSHDEQLIAMFAKADAEGGDAFTEIMRDIYQDQTLVKADPRRKLVKEVVYGKLFGAGVEKMAITAEVATSQMKAVVDAFDRSYPGVKALQRQIEDVGTRRLQAEGQGYVRTATGRRLPCDDDRVYSLTNYLIQSSAAEVFKQNLVDLDMADLTEYLIVPVHDEIVLQAPKSEAAEIMRVVQQCMTTTEGWEVPLTAGVDGPFDNWGDKYL